MIVQQDYINGDLPFIHVHQDFFADKFEYVGELASSAVFRLVHRITPAEVNDLFSVPPEGEAQIALVSKAAQRTIDNHRRVMIAFSKLRVILRIGVEAARSFWQHVESDYAEQVAQERFRRVQNEYALVVTVARSARASRTRRRPSPSARGTVAWTIDARI